VEEQVAYLPAGSKVTVTCSPTRGIEHTLGVAEKLAMRGMTIVPHIAARLVRDEAHLRDLLQHLSALRFREVFVIGGDAKEPVGRFSGALQLLRAMAEIGHDIETIGVPAYPERHPLMDDDTVRQALRDKQAYAGYMVTQICFDPLGVERPASMQGAPFTDVLRGNTEEHRPFVISSWPLYFAEGATTSAVDSRPRRISSYMPFTIATRDRSLILGGPAESPEFYDLVSDPQEETNVWQDRIEEGRKLSEDAIAYLERLGTPEAFLRPRRMALEKFAISS